MKVSILDCLRIIYDVWSRSGLAFCIFVLGFKCFVGSFGSLLVGAKLDQFSGQSSSNILYVIFCFGFYTYNL